MWMEQVARNWLTWEETGSALQLGAVNFARAGPSIIAGLFAGVMADRVSKKRLLIIAQTWSLLVYIIMTWVVLSGSLQVWHLYASTMALALGMSVSQPVRASFVPALVSPHQIVAGLSLNGTAMNGSRVLWPMFAGILISIANPGYAYLTSVVLYLLLQFVTFRITNPDAPEPVQERGSVANDFVEGVIFVLKNRLLFGLLMSRFGPITVASGFQVLIPVFAVTVLGMGAGAYGALLSAEGLGAIIGGFTIASRNQMNKPGFVALMAGSILSLLLIAVFFISDVLVFGMLLIAVGVCQITFQSCNNGAMFAATPPNMRGRMVGVRNQTRAFVPVSNLGAGAIAEVWGAGFAFSVCGMGSLLVLWLVRLWRPEISKV